MKLASILNNGKPSAVSAYWAKRAAREKRPPKRKPRAKKKG